jgi:hypothetical protein
MNIYQILWIKNTNNSCARIDNYLCSTFSARNFIFVLPIFSRAINLFPNSLQWPWYNGSKSRLEWMFSYVYCILSTPTSTWNHSVSWSLKRIREKWQPIFVCEYIDSSLLSYTKLSYIFLITWYTFHVGSLNDHIKFLISFIIQTFQVNTCGEPQRLQSYL